VFQTVPKSGFRLAIPSDLSIFWDCCLKLNQQLQPSIEIHLMQALMNSARNIFQRRHFDWYGLFAKCLPALAS
jgi:hypothetical protein